MVWKSVFVACLVAGFCRPAAAEEEIKFAPKMFADGSEAVEVSGTLTGTGVGYPNNTHVVSCVKDRKECFVTAVEAHEHYVTRVTGPNIIPITSWTDAEIVAQEELSSSQNSRKSDLLALQQQAEAGQANAQAGTPEAAQVKLAVEAPAPEPRQSSEKEQRAEGLANELAEARRAIDGLNLKLQEVAKTAQLLGQEREKTTALAQEASAARQELKASTAQHRHALEEERARGAALASELARARSEIETQVALLRKAGDEAVDVEQKPAAVKERPGVSLPAWANSDAFVKPAQAAKQPDVTPENSKPAIKPVEMPLPKRVEHEARERAMSPDDRYCSQHYRSYDPASGTYMGYDGRRHSCR